MKKIIIKLDKKKLSSQINKISIRWAFGHLKKKINSNIFLKTKKNNKIISLNCILIDRDCLNSRNFFHLKNLPIEMESFAIIPDEGDLNKVILYGSDTRGLIYAITELADRIENITSGKNILNEIIFKTIESPKTKIRSISKCFESDVEDLSWFNDKKMWSEYLDMLITNRFNRLTFTVGMQYNYPYGNEFIKDVYLYWLY